ncbi:hypothetical protein CGK11_20240 [Vibrio parahaemolyticus]|nr:hypothetical protein CGK11_20240 [Vibrio parahaemolyticus]
MNKLVKYLTFRLMKIPLAKTAPPSDSNFSAKAIPTLMIVFTSNGFKLFDMYYEGISGGRWVFCVNIVVY